MNLNLAKNPYISMMRVAWKYAGKERKRYLLIYAMFILSQVSYSLTPLLWGWFINQLQEEGTAVFRSAWIYVGLYLLLHFVDWAFHGRARILERKLAFSLSKNFLDELYHKTVHLPVKWHQDNHSGATINRVRKAYEALKGFFESGFQYFNAFSRFLISFVAMLYFSALFGSIAVLLGGLIVYIILKFDKPFIAALRECNEKEHVVSSTLFDSLSNIITVITLRLQKRVESNLMDRVMDIFPPFKRKIVINEWKWFVVDTCVVLIYFFMMMGYIYQNHVPGELFQIGGLVALMVYVERFSGTFHDVAYLYTQVVQRDTDVQTAQNIIEAYDQLHIDENENALRQGWNNIDISNLSFTHNLEEERDEFKQGLKDVDIKLEKGKKIAFIGESGSGKSTLLALLRGLYPPSDGMSITIDGKQHQKLNVISDHITLFPQEPEIFENTIEYNITLGLSYEKEELDSVCKSVYLTEVIEQLPKGLESSIQEKGVNLSGGQKQRLALARGVLAAKQSDIVLLDEPTSSVDPKTEVEIYDQLFNRFKDKVVLSALHRLHLLTKFDYVYVMRRGKIVDQGTFQHLLKHSSIFQELWKHQEEGMKA